MSPFAQLLVRNLKQLNAKERDHLMRYVYLGFAGTYAAEDMAHWISERFLDDLRKNRTRLGLGEKDTCVFAAMDYHLDWLYAALVLTCEGTEVARCGRSRPMPDVKDLDIEKSDPSLWTVSGQHEDVDLLLVLDDGTKVTVLLVEAKGVAAFDKIQLARKAIRMHRILKHSGACGRPNLTFGFVFMAPHEPRIENIWSFVQEHKPSGKLDDLKQELSAIRDNVEQMQIASLRIPGFPTELSQVIRTSPAEEAAPETEKKKYYKEWQIRRRAIFRPRELDRSQGAEPAPGVDDASHDASELAC